jgi:pyridoxal biosynthesis lyase PdxS
MRSVYLPPYTCLRGTDLHRRSCENIGVVSFSRQAEGLPFITTRASGVISPADIELLAVLGVTRSLEA